MEDLNIGSTMPFGDYSCNKLRKAFADWYDYANNEQDENCVILAIRITRGTIFRSHGAVRYNMDFVNKVETNVPPG